MIAHLRGSVLSREADAVVLDVGGVGYRVFVTPETLLALQKNGSEVVDLSTYMAVRENSMDLYGFLDEKSRDFFSLLLNVPGVGPKSALAILSLASVDTLESAIGSGDTSYLTKVSGIGPKSAKKIVLELQDRIGKRADGGEWRKEESEAVDALRALGYSLAEARDALKGVPEDVEGTNNRVKAALKQLGDN